MGLVGRLLQGSLFYMVCACSSVSVGGLPSGRVPGDPMKPGIPRAGTSNTTGQNMKYVCRGQTPSGWIAIDYISDSQACTNSTRRYNTAIVVPLATTQVGQTIEVCAEERVPTNWYVLRNVVDASRCPTEKPHDDSTPVSTVREIRRDR